MAPTQAYSVRQVCEWFWDIESRLELLRHREGDVYLWRLIRMHLYEDLVRRLGLFEAPPAMARGQRMRARALVALRTLYDSLFRNTWRVRPVDHVVMPYMRASFGEDIHVKGLLDTLPPSARLVLYQNSLRPQSPRESRSMSGAVIASMLCRGRGRHELSPAGCRLLECVADDMERRFGVRAPVIDLARFHLRGFARTFPAYKALFHRLKARRLYIVVGYTRYAPVVAAQACGMEVVELQHGTFTPYHLGYSFPGGGDVPHSPDRLLCFGRFWPEITPLPAGTRYEVIGAHHLPPASAGKVKEKEKILFLSQPFIGKRLLAFAAECAARLTDRHFVYHLHPTERALRAEDGGAVPRLPPNLVLSLPSLTVYDLLARSAIVAGVSSTALQEGMTLGCRTILVDMPSIEYMEQVVARGDALLVGTPGEFCALLDQAPLCRDPSFYYAAPQYNF